MYCMEDNENEKKGRLGVLGAILRIARRNTHFTLVTSMQNKQQPMYFSKIFVKKIMNRIKQIS